MVVRGYIIPDQKKYVSKTLIKGKFKIDEDSFNELCILSNIYPKLCKRKQKYDKRNDIYYLIADIKKIYLSDLHRNIKINQRIKKMRYKYLKREEIFREIKKDLGDGRFKGEERIGEMRDGMVVGEEILESKHIDKGNIEDGNLEKENSKVENIKKNELDENINIRDSNISIPYKTDKVYKFKKYNFAEILKNKYPSLLDSMKGLKESLCTIVLCKTVMKYECTEIINKYKNFMIKHKILKKTFIGKTGIYYLLSFDGLEIVWIYSYDYENENKDDEIKNMNVLKYLYGICNAHLKFLLFKLEKIYSVKENTNGVFKNFKFYILDEKFKEHISFVVMAGDGNISNTKEESDYVIGISTTQELFVHPQFVFDSFNANKILDHYKYMSPNNLPDHKFPFDYNFYENITELQTMIMSKNTKERIKEHDKRIF
ncbi:hypothetical protein CWI38_0236p0070 [Hamiltosporidium tvaerminnensis]|uniref:Uncharacterized protein n=1 Tax=Hamiltosporidium tvaerminnensis TaxID=1176355 RepID=A0A4Q9M264_9MICR|nr:hypothetical protein CWI38_0236p0070 [Hamiltosporidium tvaerminnensis]